LLVLLKKHWEPK